MPLSRAFPAVLKKNCDTQTRPTRAALNQAQKLFLLVKEIGIPQLAEFAGYQLARKAGRIEKATPPGGLPFDFDARIFQLDDALPAFGRNTTSGLPEKDMLQKAEAVLEGNYRPFGGEPHPLSFGLPQSPLTHWTKYGDNVAGLDIKWIWEPARFSWAFDLARAIQLKPDPRYAAYFWQKFEEFSAKNPVNQGPNWVSAQEAAMRVITWSLLYPIFSAFPAATAERKQKMVESLWQHAARIPPSLGYARSQNNNHLLSEALGLIIAGALFSRVSRKAKKWLMLGIKEFERGLEKQIETDGTYGQHSANYQRLMLHLALIYHFYTQRLGLSIPEVITERLAAATRWAVDQLDPLSGRLPNLGHNDGSLLLPLGCSEYRDYRPTLQAASLAFLGEDCLPPGPWDELSAWLGIKAGSGKTHQASPAVHKIVAGKAWASLRGVRFRGRPAHADQLHVELWWEGNNLAQDAGTFAYNEAPPWQNPFDSTRAHNTLRVDGTDQMQKAGKFLWLDQAQARWLPEVEPGVLTAEHDGFLRKGVLHRRAIRFERQDLFLVTDSLLLKDSTQRRADLHWLLPDWQWLLTGQTLQLNQQNRQVTLAISAINAITLRPLPAAGISLVRAGENLLGQKGDATMGWVSDTYGDKKPALSFTLTFTANEDFTIQSLWTLTSRKK